MECVSGPAGHPCAKKKGGAEEQNRRAEGKKEEEVPRAEAAPRSWPAQAWRGWEDRAWAEQRAWEARS